MSKSVNGLPIHILLVEDNEAHAELVMRSFEQHRISNRITHLQDGQLAIDFLRRQGDYANQEIDRPHLVLLDLRLPKLDGLEVLRLIKSDDEFNKLPVVILTTSAAEKDVARAYDYHANSYIVKPMDYEKFQNVMDDMGFYWLAWNQNPWNE